MAVFVELDNADPKHRKYKEPDGEAVKPTAVQMTKPP
jgi:hypothetical protein